MARETKDRKVTSCVADASAVLAMLKREPGHERVAAELPTAIMSAVNLSEVVAGLINTGISGDDSVSTAASLRIESVPFDAEQALEAGALRETTREQGLSLGDRACLVLARRMGLPALTADRVWTDLNLGIEIHLIRD